MYVSREIPQATPVGSSCWPVGAAAYSRTSSTTTSWRASRSRIGAFLGGGLTDMGFVFVRLAKIA